MGSATAAALPRAPAFSMQLNTALPRDELSCSSVTHSLARPAGWPSSAGTAQGSVELASPAHHPCRDRCPAPSKGLKHTGGAFHVFALKDYTNLPSTAEADSGCDTSGCCEESCEQEESGQPLLKSNNYQFC